MNDHVPKPIDPVQLYAAIRSWFRPQASNGSGMKATTAAANTESAQATIPESLDGVDIDSGLRRMAGNVKLYHKILHRFREGYMDSVEQISKALDEGDIETAHRTAHTVKGVAGNLGADDLQAAAQRVDAAFKTQDQQAVRALLPDMETELLRVVQAIEAAWPTTQEPPLTETADLVEIDQAAVSTSLAQLEDLLRSNDFEAQDALDSLKSLVINSHLQAGVDRIAAELGKYDFDRALQELLDLRKNVQV